VEDGAVGGQEPAARPSTVQSLQYEIETIKARIGAERDKIRDKTLQ